MSQFIHHLTLNHYLIFSSLLFCVGVFGLLTHRNLLSMLMSVEIILNAAALNFAAFHHFRLGKLPHFLKSLQCDDASWHGMDEGDCREIRDVIGRPHEKCWMGDGLVVTAHGVVEKAD